MNGCSVVSSHRAKQKFGTICICDQGSSHIIKQNEVHYSYSNVPISDAGTDFMLQHYQSADYLMTPSEYVKLSDVENGISEDRLLYNPYGVNTDLFKPRLGDRKFDVIMVGSWWKHKGCDLLVDACINRLHLSLLHIGSVVDCELPQSPLFKHVDFVPESELVNYYSQAKVFAMPSLDEGFGLVLLQAAACGLPTVSSTRTGGLDLKKMLDNSNRHIIIAEPLNVDNIAKAIEEAMNLPMTQLNLTDAAKISWTAYATRYYNILKGMNKNKRGGVTTN